MDLPLSLGLTPADVDSLPPAALPGLLVRLLSDPKQAMDLPQHVRFDLLMKVAAVVEALRFSGPAAEPEAQDGVVTISLDEAARITGLTTSQLMRCKRLRPAILKLTGKLLVVKKRVLERLLGG